MDKTHQQWRKDMANRKTRFFHLGRTLKLFVIALTLVWVLAGASLLEASTERIRLALSEITPYGSIELPGAQSRLSVFLPIPQRWQINQARLLISYTNSSALLADRSRLVISLNDYVLGQKTLHPESSEGQWELELPAALLPADYNALEFRVIQNYTYECSDPTAPELWTRLNLDQSYLELDYSWREKSLTLADISNYVFDPKLPGRTALHLIMPALDKESLRLAALAASAAAVRYEYRPVEITISDRPASNRDNIYIGDRKTLAGLLDRKDTSLPSGRIGIMALPADGGPDPRFVLLTLTGDTAEEVERSVRAFALISYPWPQETSISPTKVEWPDVTRYSGKGVLKPGEIYFFRDLGTPTATRRGTGPGPIDVRFRLPGDVVSPSNAPFVVSLNLAYGAGMRAESTLNILLNGEFVSAVPLNEPRGGLFQAYRVNVPTKYLKAGANTLTFDPVLGLEQRGPCQYQESGNLTLTIFDDSTIKLPNMDHWAALPDLGLFTTNGFPLNRWPDWRTTTLGLTAKDWKTAGAALNIVAMISQKLGLPPFGLKTTFDPASVPKEDLLLVGPWKSWPQSLRQVSPLSMELKYPFKGETPTLEKLKSWWMGLFPDLIPRRSLPSPAAKVTLSREVDATGPFLTEFSSPGGADGTVVGFSGRDPDQLWRAAQALWDPALQAQFSGEAALLDLSQHRPRAVSRPAEKFYYVGALTRLSLLDHVVHKYPVSFFAVLIILIVSMAWVLLSLLRRLKSKRLAVGKEGA
jgi:hypothetical protein